MANNITKMSDLTLQDALSARYAGIHLVAVNSDNAQVLGKFVYFSLSNILIYRDALAEGKQHETLFLKQCIYGYI